MKTLLRECPTCKTTTLQSKRKSDEGAFETHPSIIYLCTKCNNENHDIKISVPYPEYYMGKIAYEFKKRY